MGRGWKSFDVHAIKTLDCFKGTTGRNMDVIGNFDSERKKRTLKRNLLSCKIIYLS